MASIVLTVNGGIDFSLEMDYIMQKAIGVINGF